MHKSFYAVFCDMSEFSLLLFHQNPTGIQKKHHFQSCVYRPLLSADRPCIVPPPPILFCLGSPKPLTK